MNNLGLVLRHLRKERGMRQIEVARALQEYGVCITTKTGISHLERRGTQKHEVLVAYGNIFDISISKIIEKANQQDDQKP